MTWKLILIRSFIHLNSCYKIKLKTFLIPTEETRKNKLNPMEVKGRIIIKISSEINEIESRCTADKKNKFVLGRDWYPGKNDQEKKIKFKLSIS